MRRRGFTITSFLIALAVIAAAASILYLINRSVLLSADESDDIKKMRVLVGAIDLYETENETLPPPSLAETQRDVGDASSFVSANDPFTVGNRFPVDPAFPDDRNSEAFRISFTYLPQWILHGKVAAKHPRDLYQTARAGLLACYWYGDTRHLRKDGLDAKGPIVRVNMDGSAITLPAPKSHSLLSAFDLFGVQ